MGIIDSDTRLKEIEKALHLPPRYQESSSLSPTSENGDPEQVTDEAEQVPYTPSPPFSPIDLDGID